MEIGDMDTSTLANPFRVWAELARGLRDQFVAELGDGERPAGYAGEVLGQLASMITRSEHLAYSLTRLQEHDPEAFGAFLRALDKS